MLSYNFFMSLVSSPEQNQGIGAQVLSEQGELPLHSGMVLPITPERIKIAKLVYEGVGLRLEAEKLERRPFHKQPGKVFSLISQSNMFFEQLGQMSGIEMLQRSDRVDMEGNCADYVFGERLNESWIKHGNVDVNFWHNPLSFLAKQGYQSVDSPQAGDVVAYGGFDQREKKILFQHFGIYTDDNRVDSKFQAGPIFRH